MRSAIIVVLLFLGAGALAQIDNAKRVSSSDPAIARILGSLSHPSHAEFEVNEIQIPTGEYTHCETQTHGTRSESDCSPRARYETIHQLVLTFSLNGSPVKVVGGCGSLNRDRKCSGALPVGGIPECRNQIDSDGKVTHYVCSARGSGNFVVERKKSRYFIYPVEGKPNRRYYIPLASIDGITVSVE